MGVILDKRDVEFCIDDSWWNAGRLKFVIELCEISIVPSERWMGGLVVFKNENFSVFLIIFYSEPEQQLIYVNNSLQRWNVVTSFLV